jgi:two-component system LytT family response regulator
MRVLIVDDEPLACERLRTLLSGEPDIEIAGECHDGASALAAIRRLAPDLVFLDVQMPEMDGFAVLRALDRMPAVIFVTAFDQFAIQAFEVHALDYLLKPFDRERFQKALARARRGDLDARLRGLIEELRGRKLCPAAFGFGAISVSRDHGAAGKLARSGQVRADSPVDHRQRGSREGAASDVSWRLRRGAA